MGDIRASSVTADAVVYSIADGLNASHVLSMAVVNFPSEQMDASSAEIGVVGTRGNPIEVSDFIAMVVARGKIEDHDIKVWKFSLDQHDFLVMRVGEQECFVYDLLTKRWSVWESNGGLPWRSRTGMNWLGAGRLRMEFGTNIVAGDDRTGWLWFVTPDAHLDDADIADGPETPFRRVVMGQQVMRGRFAEPCYEVFISVSGGRPAYAGASVVLRTSDDDGKTFVDHGTITATLDDYTQEFAWRSLGQITAPGRLFWFEDDGAFQRIDSMEMEDGNK